MSGSNRYSIYKNDSPVDSYLRNQDLAVPRSKHNFSKTKVGQILPYMYAPVDCFDVVPGEQITIDVASYLSLRSPSNRELLNGCKVMFECIYNRCNDLWEGSQNFYDNGRRGDVSLTIPKLVYKKTANVNVHSQESSGQTQRSITVNADTPMSLMDFFGLHAQTFANPENSNTDIKRSQSPLLSFRANYYNGDSTVTTPIYLQSKDSTSLAADFKARNMVNREVVGNNHTDVNALPFMAYQRNWRDFHSCKNLLQNNKYWFPDNEAHFILSYGATDCVCINYGSEGFEEMPLESNRALFSQFNLLGYPLMKYMTIKESYIYPRASGAVTPEPNNPSTLPLDENYTNADKAISVPNLAGIKFVQIEGDRFTTSSPFPDLIRGQIPTVTLTANDLLDVVLAETSDSSVQYDNYYINSDDFDYDVGGFQTPNAESLSYTTSKNLKAKANIQTSFTWQDVKALEAFTVFRTRLGMTNGDYNEMIKAQFGLSPRAHDFQGTWLGSSLQTFNFSGISQTSESGDTPLGTVAGQGSSSGSGRLCTNFSVPDFGWIQVYMYVVPDTMYTQGTPRMFSKLSALEQYFPVFNELAPQYIKNKELFASGDSSVDDLPFGYEPRYEEYKGRENEVCGLSALPHSLADYDASRVMSRRFSETPNLNHEFITGTPENVDYDVFSVTDEPPFDFALGLGVTRVFPGPYMAVNADTMKIGG